MSRRRSGRRARRVQVTFWKQGDPHPYSGYTTNVSLTGMFIGTNSPLPGGTRLRIEVIGERGFMIEGVVAHARKVRGELAQVTQSGMGVRFLSTEELMRELIPGIAPSPAAASTPLDTPVEEAEPASPPAQAAPPAPVRPVPPPTVRPVPPPVRPVPPPSVRPVPPPASIPPASPSSAAAPPLPVSDAGVFTVDFPSPRHFLDVFERDLKNGGLFVSTRYPGRLSEVVTIELHPPESEPLRLRARIVQRFEPDGASLLSGMGVELLEAQAVCERLRPIVARLSVR